MAVHVVVMGVAGCGKSAVGERISKSLGLPLIEGDAFHAERSIEKMRQGLALDDDDRSDWLMLLGDELSRHPGGAVLTCSALKRAYRDRLRWACPGLRFLHLHLSPDQALERVASRDGHFYPPSLVASQFEALEDPAGEEGVLVVRACAPLQEVARAASEWLKVGAGDSTMRN